MSYFDPSKDYYSILGAKRDATQGEIERLYKRLAVRHHPDRGGSEEEMKTLNEAYRVLREEATRRAYDAEPRQPVDMAGVPPFASPSAEADMIYGKCAGAALCLGVGLVLLLLVRFQWMWFLWPLAILAAFVMLFGVLMAHAAMRSIRESLSPTHPAHNYRVVQEAVFWSAVCGGGYGVYLVLSIV